MTPREKASALIVTYQLNCKSLSYKEAKQCTLIAVDEILSQDLRRSPYDEIDPREYWHEVKTEIEKL